MKINVLWPAWIIIFHYFLLPSGYGGDDPGHAVVYQPKMKSDSLTHSLARPFTTYMVRPFNWKPPPTSSSLGAMHFDHAQPGTKVSLCALLVGPRVRDHTHTQRERQTERRAPIVALPNFERVAFSFSLFRAGSRFEKREKEIHNGSRRTSE